MNIFNTLKDTGHSWNIAIMILLSIYLILYLRFVWINWKNDVHKQSRINYLSQCPDYFLQVSDGHNENICINNHKIGTNLNKAMDGVAWEENGNWKFDSSDTPEQLMQKHKGKKKVKPKKMA